MSDNRDEPTISASSMHSSAHSSIGNSLGAILRQTRTRLGLSVADVADKTKFSPQQIEALETDSFEGGAAYLRGFVRSYARVLNLDAQRLLEMLPQPQTVQVELVPQPIGQRFNEGHALQMHMPSKTWRVAIGGLAVLVVAVAIWNFTTPKVNIDTPAVAQVEAPGSSEVSVAPPLEKPDVATVIPVENVTSAVPVVVAASSATVPAAQPVIAPYVAPTLNNVAQTINTTLETRPAAAGMATLPTQATISTIRFEFDDDAWVQIKDKSGKTLSSKLNRKGSTLTVEGMRPFNLVVGHAVAVRMYDQDKFVDLKPYIDVNVARLTLQ